MAEAATPPKRSMAKSPKSGSSKRFSFGGSKKALVDKKPDEASEESEVVERRKSAAEVMKTVDAEQERLVDEGAPQRSKITSTHLYAHCPRSALLPFTAVITEHGGSVDQKAHVCCFA